MTAELSILTLAAFLHVVHYAIYAVLSQKQVGRKYALSARDEPRVLTGMAGRAQRAMANSFEALTLFAIAVMVVTYADKVGPMTGAAAALFLVARILYLPAYLFGWVPWRSVIWAMGFFATLALFLRALM